MKVQIIFNMKKGKPIKVKGTKYKTRHKASVALSHEKEMIEGLMEEFKEYNPNGVHTITVIGQDIDFTNIESIDYKVVLF